MIKTLVFCGAFLASLSCAAAEMPPAGDHQVLDKKTVTFFMA